MWKQKPSFRFEINNFSEKEDAIESQVFVAGGCEWYLRVHPKGTRLADDHLSLYLYVAKSSTLRTGWKRNVGFYFSVLNQSDKEICRSYLVRSKVFDANATSWGLTKVFPLSKLQENGFLEKDRLIIEVYIRVIEAVDDGESEGVPEKKETVDINGFQVFASQAAPVRKIFAEHPDIALGFKPKNQVVKTAYMNILLGLIKRLEKPSQNHTETEIINAQSELSELKEVGFKLDWLKSKLEEVILEGKKVDAYGSHVQKLEERVKNLEQMENKMGSLKRKMFEKFFDISKKARADEPRVQKIEERVKNLEVIESGFRMDCLKSKLEDVTLEMKKSDDADGSRVQQLEESVKNLEMMVSDLKKKVDEEKAKSSSDGFVVVDEVA